MQRCFIEGILFKIPVTKGNEHQYTLTHLTRCSFNKVNDVRYINFDDWQKPLKQVNVVTRNYAAKASSKHNRIVGSWLLICGGMVFVAVTLGTLIYFVYYRYICIIMKSIIEKTYGK